MSKDVEVQIEYLKMETSLGRTTACIYSGKDKEEIHILVEIDSTLSAPLKFLTLFHETFHVVLKIFQLRFAESSTENCSFLHQKWDLLWFYITWFLHKIGVEEVEVRIFEEI